MIRFIAAAIFVCAVALGTTFFSFQMAGAKSGTPGADSAQGLLGGVDYVKTDVLSIPLLREGRIHGYFLARMVYTVLPEEVKKLSVPADALIVDQVFTYLYSSPHIDFTKTAAIDIDAMRNDIREKVNARIGEPLIRDVLVEQIDYLSKEEIRDNTIRRRSGARAQ